MKRLLVTSKMFNDIFWVEDEEILFIEFSNGRVYAYKNITFEFIKKIFKIFFDENSSLGSWLGKEIRNKEYQLNDKEKTRINIINYSLEDEINGLFNWFFT